MMKLCRRRSGTGERDVAGSGGWRLVFAVFPAGLCHRDARGFICRIILIAIGAGLRGVAFEYRWRTIRGKPFMDISFFGGCAWWASMCPGDLRLGLWSRG